MSRAFSFTEFFVIFVNKLKLNTMGAFHAYDIRGIYNVDFDKEVAYKVGYFLPALLNTNKVLVGRDCRVSGQEIHDYLIKGITDAGADVDDIGYSSTPLVYFGTANYGYKASVQITASHNPPEYNGMKVSRENALPVGLDTGLGQIKQWIDEGRPTPVAAKKGVVKEIDIIHFACHIYAIFIVEAYGLPDASIVLTLSRKSPSVIRLAEILSIKNTHHNVFHYLGIASISRIIDGVYRVCFAIGRVGFQIGKTAALVRPRQFFHVFLDGDGVQVGIQGMAIQFGRTIVTKNDAASQRIRSRQRVMAVLSAKAFHQPLADKLSFGIELKELHGFGAVKMVLAVRRISDNNVAISIYDHTSIIRIESPVVIIVIVCLPIQLKNGER